MFWQNEFDKTVSKKDKVQDMKINQLILEVHDTYKKKEKTTTNFEPSDESVFTNKAYLYAKLLIVNGHLSLSEKDYN